MRVQLLIHFLPSFHLHYHTYAKDPETFFQRRHFARLAKYHFLVNSTNRIYHQTAYRFIHRHDTELIQSDLNLLMETKREGCSFPFYFRYEIPLFLSPDEYVFLAFLRFILSRGPVEISAGKCYTSGLPFPLSVPIFLRAFYYESDRESALMCTYVLLKAFS